MFTKDELSLLSPDYHITLMNEHYILMEQDMNSKTNQLQSYIFQPHLWHTYNDKKIQFEFKKSSSAHHYFLSNVNLEGDKQTFYKGLTSVRRAEIQFLSLLSKEPTPAFNWKKRIQEIQLFHFPAHLWNNPLQAETVSVSQYIDLAYNMSSYIQLVRSEIHDAYLFITAKGYDVGKEEFLTIEEAFEAFKSTVAGSRLRKLFAGGDFNAY
jgi:hypothetical protein